MKIKEQIENLIKLLEDEKATNLWEVCKKIIDAVIPHNKLIIAQMSNYDMHDETHSEKVLEIIEEILGAKITELTFYELVLIYMSAYLHDSAMAMAEWEYNVLRAVEGTDQLHENILAFYIGNDFKPVHKFSEALKIVSENKEKIINYDTAQNYIFMQENEEKLLNFLAELVCDYEEFRNGYIESLRQFEQSFSDYYNMSKMIRSEYIRKTHHIRVVENISALKRRFCTALGDRCAQYFTEDLAKICRCHGEEPEKLFTLELERKDWMGSSSNIQFVAMLLRLGDVIHFSADRAPLSLFAEKQITDETSFMHWKAKFQELTYEIYQENGNVCIKYMAYCKEPDIYYFIQDYLDWVDKEIDNYYILRNRWGVSSRVNIVPYAIPLEMTVNRQEIKYDEENFKPDKDLKFVINQAKILDLLTGIQLYKDEYLCLREVYQNALDASKCMLSYNNKRGIIKKLEIEFGVEKECVHGIERKYIYCLDHGTGMNAYIIKNCFLHIGNSYYKSREFARKNTDWAFGVKPTSQFGIGILSGYMLADRIGVSTVYYEEPNKYMSFILEGVSEHFYYTKTSQLDKELLGDHGTIIKLYLKPEFEKNVNAKYFAKMPLALMSHNEKIEESVCDINTLGGNLFYIISKQIGIMTPNIDICIKDEEGTCREIYQSISIFDARVYNGISNSDVEMLWSQYHYLDGSLNPYKEYNAKRNMIEDYVIKVKKENLEIYSCLSLPKKNIGSVDIKLFDFCHFIGDKTGHIYVDGVLIDERINIFNEIGDILGADILNHSILNYYGENRPSLSVDRNSIVNWPDMDEELKKLREKFILEVKHIVLEHLKTESINIESEELSLVFKIIVRKFPFLASDIICLLKDTEYARARIGGLALSDNKISIQDLFNERTLSIENTNFLQYQEVIRQILIGRMINADKLSVEEDKVFVLGGTYTKLQYSQHNHDSENISLHSVVVKADEWNGEYAEYDLVNRLWPIVSPDLFNQLQEEEVIKPMTKRCKTIASYGNGLCGIATLDPVLIHPYYGIGIKRKDRFEKVDCYVGEIGEIQRSYWLYELSDYGRLTREDKISPALFAFIAPRKLNKQEQIRLAELETEKENAQYVKGVREGWSILFLGAIKKYIIEPGKIRREQIVKKIPKSYKELKPDIQYVFTDGSPVF
ncbi:hypothetical protein [Parablautia intestinalis]|nr:hypothetical protein [Parablautia intestinalis]